MHATLEGMEFRIYSYPMDYYSLQNISLYTFLLKTRRIKSNKDLLTLPRFSDFK
jgi:hypothetical protein